MEFANLSIDHSFEVAILLLWLLLIIKIEIAAYSCT